MDLKRFLKLSSLVFIVVAISIVAMEQIGALAGHLTFSISTGIVFLISCVVIYLAAIKLVDNKNKFLFTYVVIASIFFKLIFAVAMIILYQEFGNPDNNNFIVSFIIIYLIFTVFETYFLSAIAKSNSPKKA